MYHSQLMSLTLSIILFVEQCAIKLRVQIPNLFFNNAHNFIFNVICVRCGDSNTFIEHFVNYTFNNVKKYQVTLTGEINVILIQTNSCLYGA